MAEELENRISENVVSIPFDINQVQNADVVPRDLYIELMEYRAWKDQSQNSYVLLD